MGRVSNELSYQSEETTRTQVGSLDTLFGGGVGGGVFLKLAGGVTWWKQEENHLNERIQLFT